jgi:hypothetical protein
MTPPRRRALAVCALALTAATPAHGKAASPLFGDAREWTLTLSRDKIPAGKVSVQLQNAGEDDHDLRFQRLDRRGRRTGPTQSIPVTRPGELAEKVVTLRKGRWRLWCTLDGHAGRGMRATLRTT